MNPRTKVTHTWPEKNMLIVFELVTMFCIDNIKADKGKLCCHVLTVDSNINLCTL